MKDYANLFEQAKQSRDLDNMEKLFDEVLNMIHIDSAEEAGAKIAEARNKIGKEGRKLF